MSRKRNSGELGSDTCSDPLASRAEQIVSTGQYSQRKAVSQVRGLPRGPGSSHTVPLTSCTRCLRSGTRQSSTHSSLKSRPIFSSSKTATASTCCRRSGTVRGRRAQGSGPPSQPWSTASPSPSSVTCGLQPKPLVSLFCSCCPSGGWCRPAARTGPLGEHVQPSPALGAFCSSA